MSRTNTNKRTSQVESEFNSIYSPFILNHIGITNKDGKDLEINDSDKKVTRESFWPGNIARNSTLIEEFHSSSDSKRPMRQVLELNRH